MEIPVLPISTFLGALLVSWIAGYFVHALLVRWELLDHPKDRSSHTRPTARGGGIGIMAAILVCVGGWSETRETNFVLTVGGGAVLLAGVSFWDDLRSIPPLWRFLCHAVVGALTLYALRLPPTLQSSLETLSWSVMSLVVFGFCFLWLAGYTNSFNFMDGINGIAAGQAVVTGVGTALLMAVESRDWESAPVLLSLMVAGACAGFLPHNFPQARMFMGDVGSAPLGFLLAALVLWVASVRGWWLLVPLGLLHANFVLDTAITLVRRVWRGEQWYAPHREHFYQRLIRSGKSHSFVTCWEMALQVLVLAATLIYLSAGTGGRIVIASSVLVMWGAFFCYAEITLRHATLPITTRLDDPVLR